jgi:hypothetical protein
MLDRRFPHGVRIAAPLALLLTLLFLLAGCGGSDSTSTSADGPDPATLAPASAALYGEATVRPSGDIKDGVVEAARKVLRVEDPAAELRRLLDKDQSDGIRFSRDIEPWLGQRVGAFLQAPTNGTGDPDWAAVIAIGDRGAFDDALPRLRQGQRRAGSYRGVTYDQDDSDGTTYGARIDDFYVIGTLGGLRAAIDASRGDSLADASRYTDAIDAVPDDALAFAFVDVRALLPALSRGDMPAASGRVLAGLAKSPIVASLTANADEIAIEASGESDLTKTESSDAEVSVGQLPGDAWLAVATPPIGPLVRSALDSAGVHDQAAAQVRSNLGLDLDRDLLDPLGGLGLFARGESPLDLGGGVLLQLTDAAAAQRLLTRLQAMVSAGAHLPTRPASAGDARGFQVGVPQSPQPIVVLAKGDKLAAGYAASSAEDLLDPQQRFDESSVGKAAIGTLGDGYEPSLVVIVPPLAALLRALDQLEVADLSPVLPYVNAYRSLAIGTKRDGDRTTVRIVAALR